MEKYAFGDKFVFNLAFKWLGVILNVGLSLLIYCQLLTFDYSHRKNDCLRIFLTSRQVLFIDYNIMSLIKFHPFRSC